MKLNLRKFLQGNSIPSEVSHVHIIGSMVRVELRRLDTEDLFEAELNTEKYQELGPIQKGDLLYAEFKNIIMFGNEQEPDNSPVTNKVSVVY